MKRERTMNEAKQKLDRSGYATVLASNMHTFVDILAERKGQKFAIKVVHNIDSIGRKEALALKKLSHFIGAEPIILGFTSQNSSLNKEVVYSRFSIKCVAPHILEDTISNESVLIASRSVGIKVRIDGIKLRNLRKLNNLKLAEISRRAKISKSTLYKHEKSSGFASLEMVERLEHMLNGSVRGELEETKEENETSGTLAHTDMRAVTLGKGPFDIIAKNKNYYEISLDANSRTLKKRAEFFKAIRETFESNYPFFLSPKSRGRLKGVPVLGKAEFGKVRSEEELLDIVY